MRRIIILLAICSLSIQNLVGCSDIPVVVPSSAEAASSPGFAPTINPGDPAGNSVFIPNPSSTNVTVSTTAQPTASPTSITVVSPSPTSKPKSSPSATPSPSPTSEDNSGFDTTPTPDYTGSDSDFKPITIPDPESNPEF